MSSLAPDGKIYINTTNNVDILHVIHNPDEQGLACNVEQHGIQLPTYNLSLPGYPNYRLGALEGSICDSIVTDINVLEIPKNKIEIFPNPTSEYVNVLFENEIEKDLEFTLSNALGLILLKKEMTYQKEQRIELGSFDEGVYFYSIYSSEGIMTNGKLLIFKN